MRECGLGCCRTNEDIEARREFIPSAVGGPANGLLFSRCVYGTDLVLLLVRVQQRGTGEEIEDVLIGLVHES